MGALDGTTREPASYVGTVDRDGIVAEVRVTIPAGEWVEDHDELGERVGIDAMRLARQAITTRNNTRAAAAPPPAF
jgi:hypothetical protein